MANHQPQDRRQRSRRWEDNWRNRLKLTWERIAYVLFGVVLWMGQDYLHNRDTVIREAMTRTQVEALVRDHDQLFSERLDRLEKSMNDKLDSLFFELQAVKQEMAKVAKKHIPEIVWRHYIPKKPGEP